MQKNEVKKDPKHLNSFWPLFIVVVVSMIAGGIIFAFAYGNVLQDDIDSAFFLPHVAHPKCVPTAKVKCPVVTQKTPAK